MGIFKLNGIDYMGGGGGGNTNYEELTQLEYDALTEEEKNNGTIYFITDANSNQDGKFQPVIYSESEREIGVWTDGKPLYQKTAFVTPGNTISMVGLSLKYGQCYSINTSGGIASVPYNDGSYTVWWMSNDAIRFATQHNISQYVITYQYTKDSDQPGSGQWTPQGVPAHHYSTEEQIIGTWIDGCTVYEKTFQISSLPQADNLIEHGISNLGKVVKYWGSAYCNALSNVPIPLVSASAAQYIIHIYSFTSTVFHLERGTLYTGDNALSDITVTMQYTKSSSQGGN